MARPRELKPVRGVFERPKESGIWWINYYVNGKQHREKAGNRSAAIDLYRARKADAWRGIKLPELRNGKVTLSVLIDDALKYARNHNKSVRDYECKAEIVREAMGAEAAAEITPQQIDTWLGKFKTNATANRYKAFLSLIFREGMRNGKVQINPARQVPQRKEGTGRLRFLSHEEYDTLCSVIQKRFPEHLPEFIVSVHSGMRLTEQYSCTWSQMDFRRRIIDLTNTKNGSPRTVHLNGDALAAIESVKRPGQKLSDPVFPREGSKGRFDTRSWFQPCLEEAKITGYVWHSNRHTFCSWLAMAGASIKEIQEAAGHKTITMSARYSHLSPEHKQSVVERIASAATSATSTKKHNRHQNRHQTKTATR
ncbi:MAG: site-specific integrase [Terracidiphilus sp.]|jgi:integrase